MNIKFPSRFNQQLQVLMGGLLVISVSSSIYDRSRAAFHLRVEDLPTISLDGLAHILVIAPHTNHGETVEQARPAVDAGHLCGGNHSAYPGIPIFPDLTK